MVWLQRLILRWVGFVRPQTEPSSCVRCRDLGSDLRKLQAELGRSQQDARERSELLYELQRHYSAEHFDLQESMRNLKIERMRNAGIFADREIMLARARILRDRIDELKARLRKYEVVEECDCDQYFRQQE